MKKNRKLMWLPLCVAVILFLACCSVQEGESLSSVLNQSTISLEPQSSASAVEFSQPQSTDGEEDSSVASRQEHSVYGTVEDATMDMLVLAAQDGNCYRFEGTQGKVDAGEAGLLIGSAATVYYYGQLDPSASFQSVEIHSITVEEADEPEEPLELDRAQSMLEEMTLEEKVGQMFLARCPQEKAAEKAAQYHLGGYLLFGRDFENKTKDQVIETIMSYQAASEIPLFIGVDEEGGTVNRVSRNSQLRADPFQSPQSLYQEGGLERIEQDAAEKSQLLKAMGINVNFAPVCDVSENPQDFIYDRSFGKDAQQTAEYARTVVSATKENGIGSVLKHFPGYGSNADTHTGIAYDNRDYSVFTSSDFLPFKAGIEAGAEFVLVSHNIVNCMDSEYPASLSPRVHEILREDLEFSGVIVTDDLAMDGVRDFAGDCEAAVLAVQAGNDLLCCTDFETQIPAVLEAVKSGEISQETIDRAVLRILRCKISLGLL